MTNLTDLTNTTDYGDLLIVDEIIDQTIPITDVSMVYNNDIIVLSKELIIVRDMVVENKLYLLKFFNPTTRLFNGMKKYLKRGFNINIDEIRNTDSITNVFYEKGISKIILDYKLQLEREDMFLFLVEKNLHIKDFWSKRFETISEDSIVYELLFMRPLPSIFVEKDCVGTPHLVYERIFTKYLISELINFNNSENTLRKHSVLFLLNCFTFDEEMSEFIKSL